MDKQKQIEEMGRMIRVALEYGDFSHLNLHDKDRFLVGRNYIKTAKNLYNAGYRKQLTADMFKEAVRKAFEEEKTIPLGEPLLFKEIRKETAEKFAERFKKKISSMIIELKANWATKEVEGFEKDVHELTCNCILNTLNTIKDFTVDEICKELTGGDDGTKKFKGI